MTCNLEEAMKRVSRIDSCDDKVLHSLRGICEVISTIQRKVDNGGVLIPFELFAEIKQVLANNMFSGDRNNEDVIELLNILEGF